MIDSISNMDPSVDFKVIDNKIKEIINLFYPIKNILVEKPTDSNRLEENVKKALSLFNNKYLPIIEAMEKDVNVLYQEIDKIHPLDPPKPPHIPFGE